MRWNQARASTSLVEMRSSKSQTTTKQWNHFACCPERLTLSSDRIKMEVITRHTSSPKTNERFSLHVVLLRPTADDSLTQLGNALGMKDNSLVFNLPSYPYSCFQHSLVKKIRLEQDKSCLTKSAVRSPTIYQNVN